MNQQRVAHSTCDLFVFIELLETCINNESAECAQSGYGSFISVELLETCIENEMTKCGQ
jgi:hypothetical protein